MNNIECLAPYLRKAATQLRLAMKGGLEKL